MARLESPNSINTYNQCKRKYFYTYKLKLPRKDNIASITGKAVHDALEQFFKIDTANITKLNYNIILMQHLMNSFNKAWIDSLPSLKKLKLDNEIIKSYYQESIFMLQNFIDDFLKYLNQEINGKSFQESFNKLKPKTEIYLYSEEHNVHGFLDVILEIDGEAYIMDYKTSSRDNITQDYELQLAIYALLFKENFGKMPTKVGLHFLRHGTKKYIEINDALLNKAKKECELIQINTESDSIKDYDKNPGPFCKWRDGECSFYGLCFGVKKLEDYSEDLVQINKND